MDALEIQKNALDSIRHVVNRQPVSDNAEEETRRMMEELAHVIFATSVELDALKTDPEAA